MVVMRLFLSRQNIYFYANFLRRGENNLEKIVIFRGHGGIERWDCCMFDRLRAYLAVRGLSYLEICCPCCRSVRKQQVISIDRYLLPITTAICQDCGLVYTSTTVSGKELEQFYRTSYRSLYEGITQVTPGLIFNSRSRLFAMARFQAIRDVVGPIDQVVEIGSGLGFFLAECRSHGAQDLLGFELGETFRTFSQTTLGLGEQVRGSAFETDEDLPFRPSIVTLFHVFEHLEFPVAALQWARRVLDPSGWVVIEVPDILGDWGSLGLMSFHIAHRTHFSAQTLCNLLAENGFTPWFVSRSNDDGIYPGNLRVFARVGEIGEIGACYPLPVDVRETQSHIRSHLHLWSLKSGIARSVIRLFAMMLRR